MIYKKIDLYEYFKIKKAGNEQGILTVYSRDNHYEVNLKRLYPCILLCPGGGYEYTSFREAEPIALKLLTNNIITFVLDYSCFKNGVYPTEFFEGYLALKYIKENASIYNIDIEKLGILGFSAGGHYAGLLSNNHLRDKFSEVTHDLPFFKFSALIYPVNYYNGEGSHKLSFENLTHSDEKIMSKLDLDSFINEKSPIGFFVTTYEDSAVGYKNTLRLIEKYSTVNIPFEVHIFNKGDHGMSLGNSEVYPVHALNESMHNFEKWFELFINFLRINGIDIND